MYVVCNRIRFDCRKRRVVRNWDLPNAWRPITVRGSFESYGPLGYTRRKSVYLAWLKAAAETDLTLQADNAT